MNTLTHDQLLAKVGDAPPPWLVDGLVRSGSIGFIAGEPKVTKSWLGLHLAQAVATGTPFLGTYRVDHAVPVLYVQEEDAVETVMTRYRLLEKGHNLPTPPQGNIVYAIQNNFKLDAYGADAELTEAAKVAGAKLIILDVLNKLHTGNDTSQQHASKIMRVVENVRRATGAAILIIHHFSKGSPGRRGNQRMRGSSVFAGWSENSFYLQRLGAITRVEVESKFSETPGFSYEFAAINGGLRLSLVPEARPNQYSIPSVRARRLERDKRKRRAHVGGR